MLRYAVGRGRPYISGRPAPERVTVGEGGHPRGPDPILPGSRPRVRRVVGTTRPVRPRFGRECQMVLRTHRGPGRLRPTGPPGRRAGARTRDRKSTRLNP